MKTVANIVAISSLIAYCVGILNKKNSILLISFAIGDLIYATSYIILKDYVSASTFLLGIVSSILLGYFSFKKIKTPIYVYVILETLVIVSFVVFYTSPTEIFVVIANFIFTFFSCLDNEISLKYATLIFGILLLIYNIINLFILGIIIECIIILTTVYQLVHSCISNKKDSKIQA